MKQVKQGTRSSEFWLAVGFGLLVLLNQHAGGGSGDGAGALLALDKNMMEALAALVATYVGGRSVVKAADVYAANRNVPPAADSTTIKPAPVAVQAAAPPNAPNQGVPGAPAPQGQG